MYILRFTLLLPEFLRLSILSINLAVSLNGSITIVGWWRSKKLPGGQTQVQMKKFSVGLSNIVWSAVAPPGKPRATYIIRTGSIRFLRGKGVGGFCLNCTKFVQWILRTIIKIFATMCHISSLQCTKFDFGWSLSPMQTPALSGFFGFYF